MPVNFIYPEQPKNYSITDAMRDWGNVRDSQINRDEALGQIGREQKIRDYYAGLKGGRPDPSALSAIAPQAGMGAMEMNRQQAQMGMEQINAIKQVATHAWPTIMNTAKEMGVQPGSPQFQQIANQTLRTPMYASVLKNAAPEHYDPNKDVDWKAIQQLAGPTPEEQSQMDIAQKVAEQKALQPGRLEIAAAQAGGDINKIMLQDQLAGRREEIRNQREMEMRQIPTAYENSQIEQRKQKDLGELDEQEGGLKASMDSTQRLIDLQDKTQTGPFIGSAPVVAARKLFGDDDIAELEKGYAKASLEAIGAMKATGTTLGALNESEGKWIRDANASITATGRVNKKVLEGIQRLVEDRYKRIIKQKAKIGGLDALQSTTEIPQKREGWKIKKKPMPDGSFKYIEIPE